MSPLPRLWPPPKATDPPARPSDANLPQLDSPHYDDPTAGADADDVPNPPRRRPDGELPPDITAPSGPSIPDPPGPAGPGGITVVRLAAPVAIVRPAEWITSGGVLTNDGTIVELLGADLQRHRAVIRVLAGGALRIGAERSALVAGTSNTVAANFEYVVEHTATVWALAETSDVTYEVGIERYAGA